MVTIPPSRTSPPRWVSEPALSNLSLTRKFAGLVRHHSFARGPAIGIRQHRVRPYRLGAHCRCLLEVPAYTSLVQLDDGQCDILHLCGIRRH